jgi:hypothetical protein
LGALTRRKPLLLSAPLPGLAYAANALLYWCMLLLLLLLPAP